MSPLRLAALALLAGCAARQTPAHPAAQVTITRDDWGIAHVHGKTDADAVFGMIYAQAEDDFNRVETNYLVALGRVAEAEGESAIWEDLRQRLYVSDDKLRAEYGASPEWLRRLMDAWAAGLNHYLATHPEVKPRVIRRFEPWMALAFTEGSIGGDIERISLAELAAFYGGAAPVAVTDPDLEEMRLDRAGSNGIAIAPAKTAAGHALLLINPHTSFFFRSELQMTSDEGLDAYGAVTWGQFFVYQGWNTRLGWMHTSSGVDNVDEFLETVSRRDGVWFYRNGAGELPMAREQVTLAYATASGPARRTFTVYRTVRGPVIRAQGDRWVSFAMMDKPVAALSQSFLRTKARSLEEYLAAIERRANSSNNTIYADADGRVAYLHPQFIPRRDDRFDYTLPVDGSDPATGWQGEHTLAEMPSVMGPPNGWVQNTNDWPYSSAGPGRSPQRNRYPRYMDSLGENARGLHAQALLEGKTGFTLEGLLAAAFDPDMPGFAHALPALLAAYDRSPRPELAEAIALLRGWDHRWSGDSVATTVAVMWAEEMLRRCDAARRAGTPPPPDPALPSLSCLNGPGLDALAAVLAKLTADFGTWKTPWSEINRFQRLTGDLVQPFSDGGASIPVPFTPGVFGSLASFAVRPTPTKRRYGTSGNSFVAVVELTPNGPRAVAITAGGESGDPRSPHFNDQASRYASGALRPVYFTAKDLEGHIERVYSP